MRLVASAVALSLLVSASASVLAEDAPPPPAPVPAEMPPPAPMAPPPVAVTAPAVVTPAPTQAAAPAAPAWNVVMKEELLVDTYYMYNFSGDPSRTSPTGRVYDDQSNSFTLNYAKVAFEVDADPVTVRADLGYGTLASLISGGSPRTGSSAFAVQQAYASLKLPGTPLSIDMGRFNTTAGAEVIEANRNWIYSRSMLFFIIPVTHTGARLNLKINDMVSVQATIANGIGNDQPDGNSAKTGGLSIAIAPLPTTSIIATTYFGKEGPTGSMSDPVHFTGDLVVSHNVSDQFGLNLNIDYVKGLPAGMAPGDSASYAFGVAAMARFVANEHLNLAGRLEFMKDKSIYLDADGQEYEGTVSVGVPFAGHLEVRAEIRGDFGKNPVFFKGPAVTDTQKNQFTGTLAFLGFI
jgi:Putative beta-barrel porin-2, OmpL-like. bbp2